LVNQKNNRNPEISSDSSYDLFTKEIADNMINQKKLRSKNKLLTKESPIQIENISKIDNIIKPKIKENSYDRFVNDIVKDLMIKKKEREEEPEIEELDKEEYKKIRENIKDPYDRFVNDIVKDLIIKKKEREEEPEIEELIEEIPNEQLIKPKEEIKKNIKHFDDLLDEIMNNLMNQKILKDRELSDNLEREDNYNKFLNQLNQDMKNQKILKELNNNKVKPERFILDPYDKLVEDIVDDLIKQNNERKGIPQSLIDKPKTYTQYERFVFDISKDLITQKQRREEQTVSLDSQIIPNQSPEDYKEEDEEILKDTIKGQNSDQTIKKHLPQKKINMMILLKLP
jgi:phosphoenolpyruvate carboxylase